MATQVAIIGGGPSGLLLARKLSREGIECTVLERRSRKYVLSRIRAGVLEQGTVKQLRDTDVADRLNARGLIHEGCWLSDGNERFRIDFASLSGKTVVVYGQTEVTKDLYDALDTDGVEVIHDAEVVQIHDIDSNCPSIAWKGNNRVSRLSCEFIAGCDGFHGVCRRSFPSGTFREYERTYPFAWLGVLSETPPVEEELIYSRSPRGFALASMRSPRLSRYYIQVSNDDTTDNWTDEAFWNELQNRLPAEVGQRLITGPSIEKSLAPLRSYVREPMSLGRLFLCGDAAHIVPPTGAKGLNLAASDVHYLFEALVEWYREGRSIKLESYSDRAVSRVWKSMRFSWWMTSMLHKFPSRNQFDKKIQDAEFEFVRDSSAAKAAMAENYTGLPY